MFFQDISIDQLPHTSVLTLKKFKNNDVHTYFDLLHYFPSRYEDYSLISKIMQVQEGETVTITGVIKKTKNEFTRRGFKIQKIELEDDTGTINLIWYNQMYLINLLKPDMHLAAAGTVKKFGSTFSMEPQSYEILSGPHIAPIHTARLVPVYPEKKGLSSRIIREKIQYPMTQLQTLSDEEIESLPKQIILKNDLLSEKDAIQAIHFPANKTVLVKAQRRLAFDELFALQLTAALIRKEWETEQVGHRFSVSKFADQIEAFKASLPFLLTNAQQRVTNEILADLDSKRPMNRFVQGDVGSGKTVIAAIAAYISYLNGYQTLIMAPTEILAQQHYNTITKLFAASKVLVGIQTGSKKTIEKQTKQQATPARSAGGGNSKLRNDENSVNNGEKQPDILVGTQALIASKINYDRVGLIVIDEQHRFGVAQRAALKEKGLNPHLLTMTATPIPRTVALTLYGDLDMSVIDEMPAGRLPIKTHLVEQAKRSDAYIWIKKQITEKKTQVFIICPLIEESDEETMLSVKAAAKEYEYLKEKVFKDFTIALLHGRMKPIEKETIMREFKEKKYDILVSTSVVEVGIDIPNATVMIIEGAERYGLAQLHQLRGRVGRGDLQSYCFLFSTENAKSNVFRLKYFSTTLSGMKLAEYDLRHRGAGDIYGTQQHGYKDLKLASFEDDELIAQTKQAVEYTLYELEISQRAKLIAKIATQTTTTVSKD